MTHCPDTAPAPPAPPDLPLQEAVDLLDGATSVTILCHVQPDADTVGSGLALGTVFARRGTPVQVAFASPSELPASTSDVAAAVLLSVATRSPPLTCATPESAAAMPWLVAVSP